MKDTLSKEDWTQWAKNLFIFSTPAIFAFLTALQTGGFTFALGASYSALLAAAIDLFGKYKSGVEVVKPIQDHEVIEPIKPEVITKV